MELWTTNCPFLDIKVYTSVSTEKASFKKEVAHGIGYF